MMMLVRVGGPGFNRAGRVRVEVFRAVFDRGPRVGDPACIWQGSGGSVSVGGHADGTRVVRPAREPAGPAAGALRDPGAVMAVGGAGQLRAGRWYPVAARTAGPGDQIDVVINQCV